MDLTHHFFVWTSGRPVFVPRKECIFPPPPKWSMLNPNPKEYVRTVSTQFYTIIGLKEFTGLLFVLRQKHQVELVDKSFF